MIKKLRWKFVLYAELSIFALLAAILSAINIANFVGVANDADKITQFIADNGGAFPDRPIEGGEMIDPNNGNLPPEGTPTEGDFRPDPMGPGSPETKDSIRFFTVKVEANGGAATLQGAFRINAVTTEEAIEWAKTLLGNEKGWTKTYYRFRTYTVGDDTQTKYVTVIDQGRELSPSYRVLWGSIIGSIAGLAISFFALLYTSKKFVKPLEESDKKQKRFISDASHELKTPLTIISANNELIELQSGSNEHTEAIQRQVGRLTTMIRELNELARIEEMDRLTDKLNIANIADEVFESFMPAFEKRNIQCKSDIPDSIITNMNEAAFRKLCSIILENASKYAISHVDFSIKQEDKRIIINCKNDAAIEENGQMDRVFERFYRAEEYRGKTEGSGIGLSIAKGIVDQMKGRIYAKAKDGEFMIKIEL